MYIIVYISIYYVHIGIYLDILSEPCFFCPACTYREYQDSGKSEQQQGRVYVHSTFPCTRWLPADILDHAGPT